MGMILPINFERVYIKLSDDFYDHNMIDCLDLITIVAKTVKKNNEGDDLYEGEQIYIKRTKWFIINETNKYLSDFGRVASDEGMKPFVSYRQLSQLISAFKKKRKNITCYTMIILYVIFRLIKTYSENDIKNIKLRVYAESFKRMVDEYYGENPNDELANFLLECYNTIDSNIGDTGNVNEDIVEIKKEEFPPILTNKNKFEEIE